jgi:NTP pyrophosphatase (non-canonical NTP hydrolase)
LNTIDDYAEWTHKLAVYPDVNTGSKLELSYLALGLNGEAGEIAEKVKKFLRDGHFDPIQVRAELGDVFWYLCRLCLAMGIPPSEVLAVNIEKLESRKLRGTLQGSGDNR